MSLLERINGPEDLKALTREQTTQLAAEIRDRLIKTVSVNGGHLAPNLGTTELTLALHRVFDSPRDKFVWDVGHQAYVHKLVTGREKVFNTIRQPGGISGYCRRDESKHDFFGAGHGSTSISAALGLAAARDLNGGTENVVAIIGDGSMTGGMAFEALNHAGHLNTKLLVVLNDNEMSISPNVGALHATFTRIRTNQTYIKAKSRVESIARRLPMGEQVVEFADKARDAVTTVGTPGAFFESLGFTYLGPIDGHNLALLEDTLNQARKLNGPVLLHILTVKGKGYNPAEENSVKFHGVVPFEIETGLAKKKSSTSTYSEVFVQAMRELARKDDKLVAITAAMLEGTGLVKFQQEFPDRTFDVGMAEQHAATFGAGLACEGIHPVVAIYSTFLQRAYDSIIHDACIQNLPVTYALDRAGIAGEDGATHQGAFDLAFLRCVPNLVVMAPSDEEELRRMLRTAVEYPGPAALRFPRSTAQGSPISAEMEPLPIGQAEIVRDGADIALVAIGSMVYPALQAAKQLAAEGIEATVVNARFVKPLDVELLSNLARDIPHIVTIEEGCLCGGFGGAVLEMLESRDIYSARVHRMGLPDRFIEHSPRTALLERYGLSAEGIVSRVRQVLERPSRALTAPEPVR
ncbi:MAG TPA: 1-deoxy-D-xylulose-5-phosphate synthase [Armatimonadota bacterium]|jgi:1-deoxy-D-xylulose-5-phosphate synthase